jgi:phosphodiesterase/alkaline phosphatase D-like protein
MSRVKIAFTSCVNYKKFPEQPEWEKIDEQAPDYLFLLGDNIYMDYFQLFIYFLNKEGLGKPSKYEKAEFEKIMREKYENQWNEPRFKKLREKMEGKIFATWDDHDFGWDNAWGNEVKPEIKEISRRLFHEYMKCSTNLPEIYCHKDIEHARVIFLDNRYYADPPKTPGAKMLGDKQFEFLEEKLNHDEKYTIICAGLTLTYGRDNWAEFKDEYARFCELVKDRKNVIFLAGDIHKNKFAPPSLSDPRRPCYEIVSSGLALHYLGLPFKFDEVHNWGLLELDEDEIVVNLFSKKGKERYRIDGDTWQSGKI